MADNVAITPGSGANIRTDDVGGIQYQVVKFDLGGDGVSQLPSVNSGTKDNGTLRVILASDQTVVPVSDNGGSITVDGTVSVSGTVTVDSELTTADLDTGAGTDTKAVTGIVVAASGGSVNLTGNSGTKDNGTIRVVLATDQPQLTNKLLVTPDANSSVNLNQIAGTTPSVSSGNKDAGTLRVTLATDQVQLTNAIKTTQTPATSGGLSVFHLESAASTNATNIKASAGQVFGWFIYNANAAMRKVAFHNTSGTPTAGSSIFFTVPIPPGSAANVEFTNGIAFSTGIAITTVTGLADSNATAVAADDLNINIFYA